MKRASRGISYYRAETSKRSCQPGKNPREELHYIRRNCSIYNNFNKWSVTKSKWSIFFFRINFPSSHLSVCCGYLIESGAFEIFLQVMLSSNCRFCGPALFFQHFADNFLKESLIFYITIQIIMKNHEEWYPTSIL